MKKIILPIGIILLMSAACSKQSANSTGANPSPATSTTSTQPVAATSSADACKIVTPALIMQDLAVRAPEVAPKTSNIGGSTCTFKDGTDTNIIVQIGADTYYYQDTSSSTRLLAGIGDKGYINGPDQNNATISVIKGRTMVMINVYSKTPYTADGLKTLMKAIIDQL